MGNITVGRYSHPGTRKYWAGWIEPEDKTWIAFIDSSNRPFFFLDRDPITGACQDESMESGTPGEINPPRKVLPA